MLAGDMRRTILLALVLVAGCSAKIKGSLKLDGADLKITGCRSGVPFNFSGVELSADNGKRLRLVQAIDGSVNVAIFDKDQSQGQAIEGSCGTITLKTQNSEINGVKNIEGTATLKCAANGHTLEGSISFENCH